MDPDLFLVLGIVIAGFSIPAIFSAVSDGRAPRVPSIMILIGGGLIAIAAANKPNGYTVSQVPEVFTTVIGRYVN